MKLSLLVNSKTGKIEFYDYSNKQYESRQKIVYDSNVEYGVIHTYTVCDVLTHIDKSVNISIDYVLFHDYHDNLIRWNLREYSILLAKHIEDNDIEALIRKSKISKFINE